MTVAQQYTLFHKYSLQEPEIFEISIPNNAWILSISGWGTPGSNVLCKVNVIVDDREQKTEQLKYYVVPHFYGHSTKIEQDLDNLIFLDTFDVDTYAYSVFQVLPEED